MSKSFVKPKNKGIPLVPDALELDEEDLYVCVSYDPGETTGWAVFGVHIDAIEDPECRIMDNIEFWSAGQIIGSERAQAKLMWETVEVWPNAKIVVEDFVLRKFSSARELLSPVRVTARFDERLSMAEDPRMMILQQSALAKSITDDRLKRMGFYQSLSGQEHARDAVRHNLTWLKRAKKLAEQNMVTNALREE